MLDDTDKSSIAVEMKAGIVDALACAYRQNAAEVRRSIDKMCRRYSGILREEVDDLVQEVFTRALIEQHRKRDFVVRSPRQFFRGIARHVVIDHLRREYRHSREIHLDDISSLPVEAPDWTSAILFERDFTAIEEWISALPSELLDIWKHRYLLNETQRASCQILGITRQQLRTREKVLRQAISARMVEKQALLTT